MTSAPVAVVYDEGAAGPADIAAAGRASGLDVLLVLDRGNEHVERFAAVLRRRFDVCDITGLTPQAAVAAVAARNPAGVLTFSDLGLRTTALLAEGCGFAHWHSPAVTALLTGKLAQRRALAASGVDTTACVEVSTVDELPAALAITGLPAVIKPAGGTGGRHTRRVDRLADAVDALGQYAAPMVVEQMLVGSPDAAGAGWGDYVSVDAMLSGGTYHQLCVIGKFPLVPPFRERGYFLPSTVGPAAAAEAARLAKAAVRALGIRDGIVHTEIKFTPDGPRVLEVNGRVGGHVADLLRRGAGVDVLSLAMGVAVGAPLVPPEVTPDGVAFQYLLVAPREAERIEHLGGIAEIRALDGVDAVDVRLTAGQRVDWRDGESGRLGLIYGRVADHAALARLAGRIDAAFRPSYSYSGKGIQHAA